MKKYNKLNIKPIDSRVKRVIKTLEKTSTAFNIPIYFTGGLIRDTLMKKRTLDIDLFVENFDLDFIKTLEKLLFTSFKIYPDFFTATTTLENGVSIDISLMRKEIYQSSGALPLISQGDFLENIKRRDFSINSIVIYKNEIIDLSNGVKSILHKTLTSLYKDSFKDDPTRILRGVKFAIRLDFFFDKKTYDEVLDAFKNSYFLNISDTRFFREFYFIFQEKNISNLFSQEKYSEILENIFGNFPKILMINFCDFYKKNSKLLKSLDLFKKITLFDFFIFFLKLDKINLLTFNYSNSTSKKTFNNSASKEIYNSSPYFSDFERVFFEKHPYYNVSQNFLNIYTKNIILHKNSEIYSFYKTLTNFEIFILFFLSEYKNSIWNNKGLTLTHRFKIKNQLNIYLTLKEIVPLINGQDLINIGFSPSPEFQVILDKIYLTQLDNSKLTKDNLLELILHDKRI